MTESTQIAPDSQASANPAIARCCQARESVYEAERAKGGSDAFTKANRAFCNAMPPLSGYENIRDFVACVAHGMLINAIYFEMGTKLLYSAQVAITTLRCQPAPPKSGAA